MKRFFSSILLLAVFCVACSGPTPTKVQLAPGIDPTTDTIDEDCSYFYFLWGKSAELQGRYEEAREAYEKSLVCDPTGVHVMRKLAVLLINMGEKKSAASWINEIIKKNPKDITSRSLLANLYSTMNEVEKAAAIYSEILFEEPDNLNVALLLGALYARNKEFNKAREVLEKLVEKNNDSFVAYHYLGKLYRDLKLNIKAEEAYRKALSLNWSSMLAFELADFLELEKKYAEAIEVYQLILKNDETNETARARSAKIYLNQGKVDKALEELKKLREYATDAPKVDFTIARILLEQKRYSEATTVLSDILENDPSQSEARALLALVYHEKGLDRAAITLLEEVSPDDGNFEEAVLLMVKILRDNKEYDKAIAILNQKIFEDNIHEKSFYLVLASLYRETKNTEKAEETYTAAIDLYTADTKIMFEHGVFLDEIGNRQGAIAKMMEILQIDPDDAYALNYIGYTWAEQGENLEEALKFAQKAVQLKPEDGFIRDSLGWVYFKMGDMDNAVKEMQKAVELVPEDATINEHMGDIYVKADMTYRAFESYEKALKLHTEEEKKEAVRRKIRALKQ